MNRKQFLQILLEKAECSPDDGYVKVHLSQKIQGQYHPGNVKRMQIMQMGCCKINAKLPQNMIEVHRQKYRQSNQAKRMHAGINRKAFLLQKNRNTHTKNAMNRNIMQKPASMEKEIKPCNCQFSYQHVEQNIKANVGTKGLEIEKSSKASRPTQSQLRKERISFSVNKGTACNPEDPVAILNQKYEVIKQRMVETGSEAVSPQTQAHPLQVEHSICRHSRADQQMNSSQKLQRELSSRNRERMRKKFDEEIGKNYQKNISIQKQNKILLRQEVNKNYAKPFTPPPKLFAKSYIVIQQIPEGKQIRAEDSSPKLTANPSNWSTKSRNTNHAKGSQKQLINYKSIKVHASFNSKNSVEVASLTKIMTCILAIELCDRYKRNPMSEELKIGQFESNIGGTSARIRVGDIYTLDNMLYGLMLPSGNDASLAIAVWGGRLLLQQQAESINSFPRPFLKKECYQRFLREMNKKAKDLQLLKTNYANSHGLANTLNRSCAFDTACLSAYAMKNEYFRKIVSTKFYRDTIKLEIKSEVDGRSGPHKPSQVSTGNCHQHQKDFQSQHNLQNNDKHYLCKSSLGAPYSSQIPINSAPSTGPVEKQYRIATSSRVVEWQNTHKLLHKPKTQFIGVKTGATPASGPCLSSCARTPCGREFIIVVLNCRKSSPSRFKQTEILKKWIFKQQAIKGSSTKASRPTSTKAYSNPVLGEDLEQSPDEQQQIFWNEN